MDDQNQTAPSNTPADAAKAADTGTGTIFSPAKTDSSVNPYDLAQAANPTPSIGTPPPVFAQPATPAAPSSAPNVSSAPLNMPAPTAGISSQGSSPIPGDAGTPPPPAPAASSTPTDDSDLMAIKQSALQSLTPLVDQLPQSPEDKFKTTMMMIQASDNSSLIKKAYDAANAITDEKTRAQALLDIVNEINYFTQKSTDASKPAS